MGKAKLAQLSLNLVAQIAADGTNRATPTRTTIKTENERTDCTGTTSTIRHTVAKGKPAIPDQGRGSLATGGFSSCGCDKAKPVRRRFPLCIHTFTHFQDQHAITT